MLFNSHIFIFIFLPVCLIGFMLLRRKESDLWVIWINLCSIVFYGYWSFDHLLLFLFSIVTSQDEGYIDSTKIRNPKVAWKLGFIPGLGQLYNGKVIKGTIFIGLEYLAIKEYLKYKEEYL